MRNAVQLAAKLYDIRDSMSRFWRDSFLEKVAEHQASIQAAMRSNQCDAMQATMQMAKSLQEKEPDSGMKQALLLASYVEMVEPSAPSMPPTDNTTPKP